MKAHGSKHFLPPKFIIDNSNGHFPQEMFDMQVRDCAKLDPNTHHGTCHHCMRRYPGELHCFSRSGVFHKFKQYDIDDLRGGPIFNYKARDKIYRGGGVPESLHQVLCVRLSHM